MGHKNMTADAYLKRKQTLQVKMDKMRIEMKKIVRDSSKRKNKSYAKKTTGGGRRKLKARDDLSSRNHARMLARQKHEREQDAYRK